MKNFFKKPVFKTLIITMQVMLYIAWTVLMLYQLSIVLLVGIEESSAKWIALAIGGYISIAVLITFYLFWITFAKSYDKEFKEILNIRRRDFIERERAEERLEQRIENLKRKLDNLTKESN